MKIKMNTSPFAIYFINLFSNLYAIRKVFSSVYKGIYWYIANVQENIWIFGIPESNSAQENRTHYNGLHFTYGCAHADK